MGFFNHSKLNEAQISFDSLNPNQCSSSLLPTEHHCPDHLRNWISAHWSQLFGEVFLYCSLNTNSYLIQTGYLTRSFICHSLVSMEVHVMYTCPNPPGETTHPSSEMLACSSKLTDTTTPPPVALTSVALLMTSL